MQAVAAVAVAVGPEDLYDIFGFFVHVCVCLGKDLYLNLMSVVVVVSFLHVGILHVELYGDGAPPLLLTVLRYVIPGLLAMYLASTVSVSPVSLKDALSYLYIYIIDFLATRTCRST